MVLAALGSVALADNSMGHLGYQFRLLWPSTGDLSPDLIREQAAFEDAYVFCGEVAFFNGENDISLGQPEHGLLLVGIKGFGDAPNRTAQAEFLLSGPLGEWTVPLHVEPNQVKWVPVAFFSVEADLENYEGAFLGAMDDMDAMPHALPAIRAGCGE